MSDIVTAFEAVSAVGGLGGVLAMVILYYARRDAIAHKRDWRIISDRDQSHSEALIEIVGDSTAAITANTEIARSLVAATQELRQEVTALRKANGRAS